MTVLGNLRSIGPVEVEFRNPSLRWTSTPNTHGIRTCSIGGTVEMADGHTLAELINNPAARITKGGFTGVLEYLVFDGDAVGPLQGYYLLQSFDLDIDRQYVYGGRVAFTMTAAFLGEVA